MSNGMKRVNVYTADTSPEEVDKLLPDQPYLMKAVLPTPHTRKSLGLVAIPSIVDMMGFSGGGGPVGFAFLESCDVKLTEDVLFMVGMVGEEFLAVTADADVSLQCWGVTQSSGMLLAGYMWSGPGLDDLLRLFTANGAYVLSALKYKVPDFLHKKYKATLPREEGDKTP